MSHESATVIRCDDASMTPSKTRFSNNSHPQKSQMIMPERLRAEAAAYCEELMKQTKLTEAEVNSVEVVQAPLGISVITRP